MPTSVLDTSILVRYLTKDYETKAVSVRAFLQTASDASLLMPNVADDLEHGRGVVDAYLIRTAERMGVGTLLTFDGGIKPLPTVACVAP
jgi:predicted nucleic acid-binding protein